MYASYRTCGNIVKWFGYITFGFNYYGNKSNFTTNLCNKTRKMIEKSNGKKINLWYFV